MEEINVIMDDELKAKLKNCAPVRVKAPFTFVPEKYRRSDIPKEYWPLFKLRGRNGIELASNDDTGFNTTFNSLNPDNSADMKIKVGEMRIAILKVGLLGIKNLILDDFSILIYNRGETTLIVKKEDGTIDTVLKNARVEDAISYLTSTELQAELQNAIITQAILTKEELQGLEF